VILNNSILRYASITIFCFVALTGTAMSAELFKQGPSVFNYNFLELKYLDADGGDGLGLVGSGDIRPNIALRVDYAEAGSGNVDVDALRLGATYYIQSQAYRQADWNFAAGLDRVEDEGGIFLSAGTRYALNDVIELNGALELSTVFDTDLSVRLAGLYEISPGFSAFLETELSDDSGIGLGVRFYWR
jgi:hypothetical protein